jgi:DUF4097 and DUF4098 domain-containing protein YvlB
MKPLPSKNSVVGLMIAISLLFANCLSFGSVEDRVTKTFPVDPGGTLAIQCDIGSIAVRGEDIDSVEVEIVREVRTTSEKRASEILKDYDIQFDHQGDDVTIQAKYKKKGLMGFWNNIGKHLRVKFIIAVPSEYNVDLDTKGGSISVENIRGEVLSHTSGGSLHFDGIDGSLSGETSGGSISIGEVIGRSDIRTSGGSIRIKRAEGPVDAHTSGGSITVEEVRGTIKAHTSGGSVKAYLSQQPTSDCRLTTSGGSITVSLSEDIGLDVDAKTNGGRVHTDFPVSIQGEMSKNSLQAEVNGGGPELYLRTSGGSIYLKKF